MSCDHQANINGLKLFQSYFSSCFEQPKKKKKNKKQNNKNKILKINYQADKK